MERAEIEKEKDLMKSGEKWERESANKEREKLFVFTVSHGDSC